MIILDLELTLNPMTALFIKERKGKLIIEWQWYEGLGKV